jgi:hypothetical protein
MRLVLDEPTANDIVQELEGMRFLIDRNLRQDLEPYLPLWIDSFSRLSGLQVLSARAAGC